MLPIPTTGQVGRRVSGLVQVGLASVIAQRSGHDRKSRSTFFVALGVFLLLAARKPRDYRTLIAFAAWQSLAHSAVMIIQTIEAYNHGTPRDFKDVIITAVLGVVLLALVPATQPVAATD